MKRIILAGGLLFFLVLAGTVKAQPAVDIKTEVPQKETQSAHYTQQPTPSPVTQVKQKQITTQPQTIENQPSNQSPQLIQDIQNRMNLLETQAQNYRADPKITNWLSWWWQTGFWVGILWLFPWIFVGWQWTHFKFWGFGWPWPWWFWIPMFWFIPWLWIGWQWWLVWWVWWAWWWWLFPWIFWVFWWIILFKEAAIWHWRRRGPSLKES